MMTIYGKSDGLTFLRLGYENAGFLPDVFLLLHSERSQLPNCKLPSGEAYLWGKKLRDVSSQQLARKWIIQIIMTVLLQTNSPPVEPLDEAIVKAYTWIATLWEIMSHKTQLSDPRFLTHRKYGIKCVCCFTSLTLGVICHTAIDN